MRRTNRSRTVCAGRIAAPETACIRQTRVNRASAATRLHDRRDPLCRSAPAPGPAPQAATRPENGMRTHVPLLSPLPFRSWGIAAARPFGRHALHRHGCLMDGNLPTFHSCCNNMKHFVDTCRGDDHQRQSQAERWGMRAGLLFGGNEHRSALHAHRRKASMPEKRLRIARWKRNSVRGWHRLSEREA